MDQTKHPQKSLKISPPRFQEIITRIKRDILLQHYRPGDALPREETLAKAFGVGRALIREALGMLKAQGYLEARRGSSGGTFVCDLLHSQGVTTLLADLIAMRSMTIKHLCDVRVLIEPEAARMAALEASASQLQQLGDLMYNGQTAKTVRERINFDVEFHTQICELSGNPFFSLLMRSMMSFLQQFLQVLDDHTTYLHDKDIHGILYDAISSRDHQRAYETMFAHVVIMKQRFCDLEKDYLNIQARNLGK
ncbi:MAG: FadR family transcriptional regulator [Proteobacteria bacterium]|nr:FadR family transcriptional regulator [Pseudomonadota bacterium]MBU1582224.1 FadR family transcriptional regulator [Pseudomonadota bacterium]MBU2452856.1 FadR family transcriptional regulator [Pseudomonadota bacterium]MBU2631899.1 FadR family transcriptional regulator [Pseudomonadota bacterium]